MLEQLLGVRPKHLELAQGRQVHDHGLLATGPVLVQRALIVVAARQPVAAVLAELPRQSLGPRVEARLLRELGLGVGGHPVADRARERVLGCIHAHVDLRGVPAVGRVDVVGARGGRAHQVGHRPQQHVVAWPRPRLVEQELVGLVEEGVVEEVQGRPAAPCGDAVRA